jgi:hypothetical protein
MVKGISQLYEMQIFLVRYSLVLFEMSFGSSKLKSQGKAAGKLRSKAIKMRPKQPPTQSTMFLIV